jgi:hypothetical protein
MQLVFGNVRLDRWQLDHLVTPRLAIVSLQRPAATPTGGGLTDDDLLDLIQGYQRPLVSQVSGLPPTLPPRGLTRWTAFHRGWIRGWGTVRILRILIEPGFQRSDALFQASDGPLQSRDGLLVLVDQREHRLLHGQRSKLPNILRERRVLPHAPQLPDLAVLLKTDP